MANDTTQAARVAVVAGDAFKRDRRGLAVGGKVIFMPPCLFFMENP
jgi:hypothetical protein